MPTERAILDLVNQRWTCPVLDWWGAVVNATDLWFFPVLALLLWLAFRGGPRGRMALLMAFVALGIGDGVLVKAVKAATARARPAHSVEGVRLVDLEPTAPRLRAFTVPVRVRVSPLPRKPLPRSFPSGHAWNAFAAATLVAFAFPRKGLIAFVPAAAIAYSRVYVGIHWPTDVLASAIAAPLFTWAVVAMAERAWTLVRPLLAPRARGFLAPLRPPRAEETS